MERTIFGNITVSNPSTETSTKVPSHPGVVLNIISQILT